jgi:hypothetical protein
MFDSLRPKGRGVAPPRLVLGEPQRHCPYLIDDCRYHDSTIETGRPAKGVNMQEWLP